MSPPPISLLAAQIEAARLLAVETARLVRTDSVPAHQAATLKVYASELTERLAETALDLLGPEASLRPGPDASLIAGRFEYAVRDGLLYTIGGRHQRDSAHRDRNARTEPAAMPNDAQREGE